MSSSQKDGALASGAGELESESMSAINWPSRLASGMRNALERCREKSKEAEYRKERRERRVIAGSFVNAGLVFVTAIILYCQLNVFRATLVVSDRPWIWFENPTAVNKLTFNEGGASVLVEFPWKNTGKSPALNTHLEARLLIGKDNLNLSGARNALCEQIRARKSNGKTIFPTSNPIPARYALQTDEEGRLLIEKARTAFLPIVTLYVVGCIGYTYGVDQSFHETGFVYEVFGPKNLIAPADGDAPVGLVPFDIGADRTN